jgi:hypothetical protein
LGLVKVPSRFLPNIIRNPGMQLKRIVEYVLNNVLTRDRDGRTLYYLERPVSDRCMTFNEQRVTATGSGLMYMSECQNAWSYLYITLGKGEETGVVEEEEEEGGRTRSGKTRRRLTKIRVPIQPAPAAAAAEEEEEEEEGSEEEEEVPMSLEQMKAQMKAQQAQIKAQQEEIKALKEKGKRRKKAAAAAPPEGEYTKRISMGAHRLMCWLRNGQPRQGKGLAVHTCENTFCLNPLHLEWGSHKDNAQGRRRRPMSPMTKRKRDTKRERERRGERT